MKTTLTAVILAVLTATALNAEDTVLTVTKGASMIALSPDKGKLYVSGANLFDGPCEGNDCVCPSLPTGGSIPTTCQKILDVVNTKSRTVERTVLLSTSRPPNAICTNDTFGIVMPAFQAIISVDPVTFKVKRTYFNDRYNSADLILTDCAFSQDGQSLYAASKGEPGVSSNTGAVAILDANLNLKKLLKLTKESGGIHYIGRVPNQNKFYAFVAKTVYPPSGGFAYQGWLLVINDQEISKIIPLPIPLISRPSKIFFRPDGTLAYIPLWGPNSYGNGLIVVDTTNDELTDFLPFGSTPTNIQFVDNATAYIYNYYGYTWDTIIDVWSLLSNKIIENIAVPVGPKATYMFSPQSFETIPGQPAPGYDTLVFPLVQTGDKLMFLEKKRPIYTLPILTSAATFLARPIVPGELETIWGNGLSVSGPQAATVLPLPSELGGVRVFINGIPAPLLYTSPTQINFQIPYGASGAQATVEILPDLNSAQKITTQVPVELTDVGVFATELEGARRLIIVNASRDPWEFVTPGHPVLPREWIAFYATGLGATTPAVPAGAAAPYSPLAVVKATVEAKLNGVVIPVGFAGLCPGFAGLYQINIQVPPDTQPGPQLFQLTVGDSSQYFFLPVGK